MRSRARSGSSSEIVVVANRCTDATQSIAEAAGAVVVVDEHRNFAATRNAGVATSIGEVVVTIDADTVMHPYALAEVNHLVDSRATGRSPIHRVVLQNESTVAQPTDRIRHSVRYATTARTRRWSSPESGILSFWKIERMWASTVPKPAPAPMHGGRCAPYLGHMNLLLVIIAPFPLGFFLRNRTAAFIAYIATTQFLFTFQTAWLLLDWGGGDEAAFGGPFPDHDLGQFFGYGAVNAIVFVVGLGLVTLGVRLGQSRRNKANRVELTH